MEDTGHILFDAHGCGPTHRTPLDDGFSVMREPLSIDPAFRPFHDYCIANSIPF